MVPLKMTRRKSKVAAVLAAVALLLILVVSPWIRVRFFFFQRSFLFYLMTWTTMATALNIMYGYTGYLPFGFVAFYGVGAYATAIMWSRIHIPIALAIPLSGIIGVCLAFLLSPTLRLKGIYFAITNFACANALQIVISISPEKITGGSFGIMLSAAYDPLLSYYAMFLVMVVTISFVWWLSNSRLGLALRCIKEDDVAACVMGVDIVRCRLYAWLFAALFASLVGSVDAWNTAVIDPPTSFSMLITARSIVYAMFGGLGTVSGPVIGTLILHTLDEVIWSSLPMANLLLLGLMVFFLILFFPKGIVGTARLRRSHLLAAKEEEQWVS